MLADVGAFWWSYAYFKDTDPKNPMISPLFGDLKGLAPLLFQASKCEMLYSDSVRVVDKAKKAGVDVSLQTWDDMPHVFQGFGLEIFPEAKEAIKKIGEFIHKIIQFN
jgi:monoterpene epsilon-lactone hydrolase